MKALVYNHGHSSYYYHGGMCYTIKTNQETNTHMKERVDDAHKMM